MLDRRLNQDDGRGLFSVCIKEFVYSAQYIKITFFDMKDILKNFFSFCRV